MELKDLFVSHKLVEPVSMEYLEPVVPFNLYLNLPRVKQTLSEPEEKIEENTFNLGSQEFSNDMSTWKVGFYRPYGWKVKTSDKETPPKSSGEKTPSRTYNKETPSTITVDWLHEEMKDDIYKPGNLEKAYQWVQSATKQGISYNDAIALAGHVYSESKFNNNAVNDTELRGNSTNRKTHGWANAGEGLMQITHWDTKKRMIEKYNSDPNRKGERISIDKDTYSRPNSRHISSVDMDDAILFVKYFYEDRLNQDSNFEDLVGDFYLQKAGRGHFTEGTLIDRAYRTGEKYRKFNNHNYNAFIQSLRFSTELKKMFNNG